MTNTKRSTSNFNKKALQEAIKRLVKKLGGYKTFEDDLTKKAHMFGYVFDKDGTLPTLEELRDYTRKRTPRIKFILLLAYAYPEDVQLDSFMN